MSALADAPTVVSDDVRLALVGRIPTVAQQTATATVAGVETSLWTSFAEWANQERRGDPEWAARYLAAVHPAQSNIYGASASLYADYLALASGKAAATPAIGADVLIGLDAAWVHSPPKRMGALLAQGKPFGEAVDFAGRYAASLGSLDVAWTQRRALVDVSESNPNRLRGQRKVPHGGSCGWCQVVADRRYSLNARIPTHAYDRCGVAPIVEDDAFQPGQLAGKSSELIGEPAVPSDVLEGQRFAALAQAS